MKEYLKYEQRLVLTPRMMTEDYFRKGSPCQSYLNEWEQVLRGRLESELNKVIVNGRVGKQERALFLWIIWRKLFTTVTRHSPKCTTFMEEKIYLRMR
jgi:hypothetical protein